MRSKNCFHFLTLSSHENVEYGRYAEELKLLSEQFIDQFSNFKNMDSTFNIFANPYKWNVEDAPLHLQLELIELPEDSYLKSKFDDVELSEFYRTYLSEEKYPQLRVIARKKMCAFESTYKCEQLFSIMKI